ncbi:MAG: hypothetical protein OJF52_000295 [Nitrospira sp.]|nr:MAG: hypothetical protein OJF52_000295 [Nitrospira sp.]
MNIGSGLCKAQSGDVSIIVRKPVRRIDRWKRWRRSLMVEAKKERT